MLRTITGIGYDSHRFKSGRKLVLGGVEIPYELGLDGHSDADALVHAIIDAILGAAGKRDIGFNFPDTDPRWKDANSIELLKRTMGIIGRSKVIYLDAVIITEKPKLSNYVNKMIEHISAAVNVATEKVNIKAKTNEKMGFSGREEGLAVMACVTLERDFND